VSSDRSGAGRDLPVDRETVTAAKGTAAAVDVTVDPRTRTTVVVFLAGPVILILHFLVVYLVAEAGCTGDGPGLNLFDPPVPTVATLVATGVAALACCGSAWWGYRRWRSAPSGDYEELVDHRPLALVGLLMSLLALVTVLLVGLPALVLEAC
jgi:hypothetical protein